MVGDLLESCAGQSPSCPANEYILRPNVILVEVQDGTARLLDLGGTFYALPAVGAMMLRETLSRGAASAVSRVSDQYGVGAGQVEEDLEAFLNDLQKKGLICRGQSTRRVRWPGAPRRTLGPLIRAIHLGTRSLKLRVWLLLTLARLSLCLFGWAGTVEAWRQYPSRRAGLVPEDRRESFINAVDESIRNVSATHVPDGM